MTYSTQFGSKIEDKEPYIYSEYERNVLNKIPANELIGQYQNIAELDYGPLNEGQRVNPLGSFKEGGLIDMSALDYVEKLTEENKLVLFSSSNITNESGPWAGETAHFNPMLNPNLSEGPDTLFLREHQYTGPWDTPEFQLKTLIHELGHAHEVENLETSIDNKLVHKEENLENDYGTHRLWDESMEWFIKKYVE